MSEVRDRGDIDSEDVASALQALLADIGWMDREDLEGTAVEEIEFFENCSTDSFREAGLLTCDDGLVVTLGGREFQITVVRSR